MVLLLYVMKEMLYLTEPIVISTNEPINSKINVILEGAASTSSSDFADAYGIFIAYSNATGTAAFVSVEAQCFDNPPLRP